MKKKTNTLHTSKDNARNSGKRKKWTKVAPLVMCGIAGSMFFETTSASAHGYIENSRAHMGKTSELGTLSYNDVFEKYGAIIYEPQSLEAQKGFPFAGPADGQIASAGHSNFAKLDIQDPLRWKKVDIQSGLNTFVWKYTAEHPVAKWSYYITKQGWDQNKPLNRNELEEIKTIDGGNKYPRDIPNNGGYVHEIDIPADRNGYHVILGVWDVGDTANAFYQVMDVNIKAGGEVDTEAPTIPTKLEATADTTKIKLKWEASTDNVGVSHYNVYRNGEKLAPVTETEFEDVNLTPETEYTYEVSAVDKSGNESAKTMPLRIKTEKTPDLDTEAPTAPTSLHSMGETETTVDLMWTASTDNVGVDHYEVYRDNKRVHTNVSGTRFMDTGLQQNTEYMYTVKAVDAAGNVSKTSNTLIVKTKQGSPEETLPGETSPEGATTWDKNKVYNAGDRITFNGNEYEAKWWTLGNQPDISDEWKLLSDAVLEWNASKAYNGGERVQYQGVAYKAKWWTLGEIPGESQVWEKQ
ncbi:MULTISPECIES: lytic polysaccharide monooxygenase [Bacillus cereus group]|uniref:lytic polysaccharide monooxygenase n=1 Tax=Bacillus cereus group TaxID=86661 RepID=UPI000279EAB0|nr:lytic polysaccharide monooxygenase [Bacillus cereus]EJR28446.1 hypothetical protein IIE_05285 [Bacillus cereus VD045]